MPCGRSLAECKKRGWPRSKTEHWVPATAEGFKGQLITKDLFSFGDILALDGRPGVLMIQATSAGHIENRARKIVEECGANARAVLDAGNRISVWGWAKRGARGRRKLWTLTERAVTLKDLDLSGENRHAEPVDRPSPVPR